MVTSVHSWVQYVPKKFSSHFGSDPTFSQDSFGEIIDRERKFQIIMM